MKRLVTVMMVTAFCCCNCVVIATFFLMYIKEISKKLRFVSIPFICNGYLVAETSIPEIKHHTQRVGEIRFITLAAPEELTLQALSPDYRVFIDRL